MRCNTLTWLWCMWRARRAYRKTGALFSQRVRFLEELRPYSWGGDERVAYPDAFLWITPADVHRANKAAFTSATPHER